LAGETTPISIFINSNAVQGTDYGTSDCTAKRETRSLLTVILTGSCNFNQGYLNEK